MHKVNITLLRLVDSFLPFQAFQEEVTDCHNDGVERCHREVPKSLSQKRTHYTSVLVSEAPSPYPFALSHLCREPRAVCFLSPAPLFPKTAQVWSLFKAIQYVTQIISI